MFERTTRRGKIRALLAGGLVLGVGSAATLAAWTDTEWVWGGDGNGNNLGTSSFEMEQNVWNGLGGIALWADRETAPGGQLTFGINATDLTPGDTVYASVQLRAKVASDPGVVVLAGAVDQSAAPNTLFAALVYEAKTGVAQGSCNAGAFAGGGTPLVPPLTPLATGSVATTFNIDAGATALDPGAPVNLCFAVTLPATAGADLQGLAAQPAWAFQATST